jgi:transcriptional regulator with XRE-family HTH domain
MVMRLAEAHELRWHQTTATRVENGERPVRLFEALAIADVLDVSLEDLLDDPDSPAARRRRSERLQGQMCELDRMTLRISMRRLELEDELVDVDPDEAAAQGLIDQDDANDDGEDANDGEHRPSP